MNWAFYLGHHWAFRRVAGEPQLVFNYTKALSDYLTNFTFGKGLTFQSPKHVAHIVPALIERILTKDNKKQQLLWGVGNLGSVSGDAFVKVAYEEPYTDGAGFPHAGRVRVLPINPAFAFPEYAPHDMERLIRFKLKYRFWATDASGTRQVYTYCVDDATEALTKRGWKHRQELTTADEVLAIDPVTHDITWEPVLAVNEFDWDAPLTRWQNENIDALTTPNHRWMTQNWRDRDSRYALPAGEHPARWKTTGQFTPGRGSDQLVLSGGHAEEFATIPKYDDELVELIGWVVTEGTYWKSAASPNAKAVLICQDEKVNPDYVARIRRLARFFRNTGATVSEYRQKGRESLIRWYLGKGIADRIRELAPDKQLTPEFLCSLTRHQAELLYETLIDADGSRRKDTGLPVWVQKDQGRTDSFQMLVAMLGMRSVARGRIITDRAATETSVKRKPHAVYREFHVSEEHYTGKVWCPSVPTKTWLARRNGVTYWTGNTEIITDDIIEEYINDRLIRQTENPLGVIPVVHVGNKPAASSPWGLADIQDILPLNRAYNEVATDILDIINYHTAPVTIVTGAKANNMERGANKLWGIPQADAKVYNLAGGAEGLPHALEMLDRLKIAMHEMTGVPETALGQAQPISNTSGVALSIQFMPLMQQYGLKKTQYEEGWKQIMRYALMTLFLMEPEQLQFNPATDGLIEDPEVQPEVLDILDPDIYDLDVVWPPPLPVDVLIKLQEITEKMSLGLESRRGALLDLGEEYPDEKRQELFDELILEAKMDGAKRLIQSSIDAAIMDATGMVPTAEGSEPAQPPPDQKNADGSTQPVPAPPAPAIAGLGDIKTMVEQAGAQMYSELVTTAYGTKIPSSRKIDKGGPGESPA